MFLWLPLPTKTSWHNARESAESGGTIHLEINFSSKVYSKVYQKGHLCRVPHLSKSLMFRYDSLVYYLSSVESQVHFFIKYLSIFEVSVSVRVL